MICKSCGEDKKHEAHGLCQGCYGKQYHKLYRDTHKDEIKRNNKIYYEANREKINAANRKRWYINGGKPMCINKSCPVFLGVHIAEQILSKAFKDVETMPYGNTGFDFICNKGKKIDVKSACVSKHGLHKGSWSFGIRKNQTADFFLCLAFDNRDDLTPLHMWLIPSKKINYLTCAGISKSTILKWDEYKLNINAVTNCCETMKKSNKQ